MTLRLLLGLVFLLGVLSDFVLAFIYQPAILVPYTTLDFCLDAVMAVVGIAFVMWEIIARRKYSK